jgi:hypothetical protein
MGRGNLIVIYLGSLPLNFIPRQMSTHNIQYGDVTDETFTFPFNSKIDINLSVSIPASYSEGPGYKLGPETVCPEHLLSVVSASLGKRQDSIRKEATNASFHILSNSLFTNNPIDRHCTV